MRNQLLVAGFVVAGIATLGSTGRAAAADFAVTATGASSYDINGQLDPGLTLTRGRTYTFAVAADGHPFLIKTVQETGTDNLFDTGVTNNGTAMGTLTFTVPASAPATLYYQCQFHDPMTGKLTIVSAASSVPATTNLSRGLLLVGFALLGFAALVRVRRRRALLKTT